MKKVLVAFVMILLLVSLCACSVPADSFMSRTKVNSLVKNYPEPKAVVTLNYTTGSVNFEVQITYKLLLDKAPIAVTRFIQIANEGGYDGTLVDTLDTSYKYLIMGRYGKLDGESKYYNFRSGDVAFAGEFAQNGYREPSGGYAEFKTLSLAMYHENDGEHFNSANGTLILALEKDTLNPANYAVFAEFESVTVREGEGELKSYPEGRVPDYIKSHLLGFTARTTRSVYDLHDENKSPFSVQIMSTEPTLKVTVSGSSDNWKKLPTIR